MNIKIIEFDFNNNYLFEKALKIRMQVFVEEQKVPENIESDGLDNQAKHFLVLYDEKPIATTRYRITKNGYKLERFAVLKEYRRKKIGTLLLDFILNSIPDKSKLYFNSQISAIDFYKSNGFITTGKSFYEAGIKHYKMINK